MQIETKYRMDYIRETIGYKLTKSELDMLEMVLESHWKDSQNSKNRTKVPRSMKTSDHVTKIAAKVFCVPVEAVMSRSRERGIKEARFCAMWMLYRICKLTYKHIGRHYGRDHSTVINACQTWDDLIDTEPAMLRLHNEVLTQVVEVQMAA